jgi:anaerobic selenocysteine-containing dehydrogenase
MAPGLHTTRLKRSRAQPAEKKARADVLRVCGPGAGCGIYAFVKDGRLERTWPALAECPVNRGGVCVKGQAAPQWVYSPDG